MDARLHKQAGIVQHGLPREEWCHRLFRGEESTMYVSSSMRNYGGTQLNVCVCVGDPDPARLGEETGIFV